jgi:hypothetical protein
MNTKDKQQEREKQIAEAAIAYSRKMYNESTKWDIIRAFLSGAVFADFIPRPGLVEIEDVRAIHLLWLEDDNDNSDFLEYFVNYCKKKGWL